MKKQDDSFVIICFFVFLFFASQINCKIQVNVNQQGQKERDLIEKLPGQPPVSFKQYGGYVTVDETAGRALYYYFVENTKANASAPLVLWLNGGPGCSSLGLGAMQELGPFRVHSDGKTLYANPYAWNNAANLLFLESPAEVGFSYTNTSSDLKKDVDILAATDSYTFLVKWLERFPEYKDREFYIAGESYGGHYVPQLAQTILHHNKNNNNNQTFINLQGIFLGNPGLEDTTEGPLTFYMDYGLGSRDYLLKYQNTCSDSDKIERNMYQECGRIITKIYTDDVRGFNRYNIYVPLCQNKTLTTHPKSCTSVLRYEPCNSHYVEAYMNLAEVQETLHAKSRKWMECNKIHYKTNTTTLIPVFKELIGEYDIRIWIYSGDTDAMVPTKSTIKSMKKMNLTVDKVWRPWYDEREVGGYTEEYKEKVVFATVKGAGHEVPTYQPRSALTLFTHFVYNTSLPSRHVS